MGRKGTIDWTGIDIYIRKGMNKRDIAKLYDISYTSVTDRARKLGFGSNRRVEHRALRAPSKYEK